MHRSSQLTTVIWGLCTKIAIISTTQPGVFQQDRITYKSQYTLKTCVLPYIITSVLIVVLPITVSIFCPSSQLGKPVCISISSHSDAEDTEESSFVTKTPQKFGVF